MVHRWTGRSLGIKVLQFILIIIVRWVSQLALLAMQHLIYVHFLSLTQYLSSLFGPCTLGHTTVEVAEDKTYLIR